MRTIRIVSPEFDGGKSIEIESSVETWGELKAILSKEGISYNEMSVVVRQGKIGLVEDDTELPKGNLNKKGGFDLYLSAQKVNSGQEVEEFPSKSKLLKETVKSLVEMAKEEGVVFKSKDNKTVLATKLTKHFAKLKKNASKVPSKSTVDSNTKEEEVVVETSLNEGEVQEAWISLQDAIETVNDRNRNLAKVLGFNEEEFEAEDKKELVEDYKKYTKNKKTH